ncbi:MAG TPA: hypothetical protein VIN00_08150 [Candidatus Dormibacteraeota bacterium]
MPWAHFQLVTVDGEALGVRELARPDWPPGSVIYRPPGEPNLRVVDYVSGLRTAGHIELFWCFGSAARG